MTLHAAIDAYVALRRALGADFTSAAKILRSFGRAIGDVALESIQPEQCAGFCKGSSPHSRFRIAKHVTLRVFFRYLVGRGYLVSSPHPEATPPITSSFTPYIYSHEEIQRLLDATEAAWTRRGRLEAETLRTLLLLLYGTGLRIGEALRLRTCDVDLQEQVLTILDSKFFKSRLVPIGTSLRELLARHRPPRRESKPAEGARPTFFTFRTGEPISYSAVRGAFARTRELAGVHRPPTEPWQPRLHDFRATFAVHRLVSWYREGADVQVRLPWLATYLGHAGVAGTQVYLSLTPALLSEASLRFERYALTPQGDRDA